MWGPLVNMGPSCKCSFWSARFAFTAYWSFWFLDYARAEVQNLEKSQWSQKETTFRLLPKLPKSPSELKTWSMETLSKRVTLSSCTIWSNATTVSLLLIKTTAMLKRDLLQSKTMKETSMGKQGKMLMLHQLQLASMLWREPHSVWREEKSSRSSVSMVLVKAQPSTALLATLQFLVAQSYLTRGM